MDESEQTASSNGHHADTDHPRRSVNPYVDALYGGDPPEISRFELHTDPYANMLPRVASMTSEGDDLPVWEATKRERHPWFLAVSVVLILILILPAMIVVFAKIFP